VTAGLRRGTNGRGAVEERQGLLTLMRLKVVVPDPNRAQPQLAGESPSLLQYAGNHTSLPKVIWQQGRVAAPYRSLWTMARPKFTPKNTPARGPIDKPHHLPHYWTRPTYDAKRHPDPIRRFPTMH